MNISDLINSISEAFSATSLTEWFIFISAIIYVILAAAENVWCWLFGIISSALSVYLCYTGQLFLESALSVFYVLIGIYGWYQWLYGSKNKTEIPLTSVPIKKNLFFIVFGIVIWIPLGFIAQKFSTQALPYLDAFITSFSIIATWMTAKKILENWLYWIIIDAFSVILYGYRDFYLIALLYTIYTILAIVGYFSWRKKMTLSV
jgi:nicotinamide mononucleotide transporter